MLPSLGARIGNAGGLPSLALAATLGCGQPAPPQQQIDVVGIRSELLVIGQAEGHYLAEHSTYATLEQLQEDSLLSDAADRRGYRFSVAVDGSQGFSVTATPSDAGKKGWPTLAIDQTMQVTER
jgi:hypothetical protein